MLYNLFYIYFLLCFCFIISFIVSYLPTGTWKQRYWKKSSRLEDMAQANPQDWIFNEHDSTFFYLLFLFIFYSQFSLSQYLKGWILNNANPRLLPSLQRMNREQHIYDGC